MMDFVPHTDEDRKHLLDSIGIRDASELFSCIPSQIRLNKGLKIPDGLSEPELKKKLEGIASKNRIRSLFLGAGAYRHHIPSVVSHIISRSEFYTAYTPYQAEISQGILQAIYEYQTMVCRLMGLGASNASLYDGATALAESCIMAKAITRRDAIIVLSSVHPEHREVLSTYGNFNGIRIVHSGFGDDGCADFDELKKIAQDNKDSLAAIVVQSPNFFGCVEDVLRISGIAHDSGGLCIQSVVEPTSLGMLASPGEMGADIACGEGQCFGNPLSFGGPYLGMIAARNEYTRFVPGRIVGMTKDSFGRRGFVLNLQAREQHIRREKALSNICSNEALCALAATVYLCVMGPEGLRSLALKNAAICNHLKERIKEKGYKIRFDGMAYNEFAAEIPSYDEKKILLSKKNICGGARLDRWYPELKDCVLFCATEMNTKEEIDALIGVL